MRTPLIAGNWKMYKTPAEAAVFVKELRETLGEFKNAEVIVCPPFVALASVARELDGSIIGLGAQNMFCEDEGAYTGEVAPPMLKEVGCSYVILGHSERRQYFGESDQLINRKVQAALKAGLTPIVCVGETLEERKNGITGKIIEKQLGGSLADLGPPELSRIVVAYEPVWAIGTGLTAEAKDAQQVNGLIRGFLIQNAGPEIAQKIRILYGGSVKPDNIAGLMAQPDVDGALVGGASLQVNAFSSIIRNCYKNASNKGTPLALVILDGWGLSKKTRGNAIASARTPNLDRLFKEFPFTALSASGEDVGLPEGQMGNSEVGHLNIGAGRVVYQDFTRINKEIREGTFYTNKKLLAAIEHVKKNNSTLHLMGLLSDGGVHSHIKHLFALLDLAKSNSLQKVRVHCFLDGRDVPPDNALEYIQQLEDKFSAINIGKIATVMGRYYAMDRDHRWDRIKNAYDAMVLGEGLSASSASQAIKDSYRRNETDEFVRPTVIINSEDQNLNMVKDGDSVIIYNFRPDRARQITHAFVDREFEGFNRTVRLNDLLFTCMTLYDDTIDAPVAYEPHFLVNTLGETLSKQGVKQLRLAETEKYAHVTFFFNGGMETPYPGEDRLLISSPKVKTYDLKPEMSAFEVTSAFLERLAAGECQVIIMNYANADMVGHTGILEVTVKAIEAVDYCLGQVIGAVLEKGGTALVTADHGNAEEMQDEDGKPHTAHTTNHVPFILVNESLKNALLRPGRLEDIAPTVLYLLGIPKPPQMTGNCLIAGLPEII